MKQAMKLVVSIACAVLGAATALAVADTTFYIPSIPETAARPGEPAMPVVEVYDNSTHELLSEASDYTISYTNNTQNGVGQVVVSGLGNYAAVTNTFDFNVYVSYPVLAGMTPLRYVEITGTQFYHTGLRPSDHQIEVEFMTITYVDNGYIFGTEASNAWNYPHFSECNHNYCWGYAGSQGTSSGKKSTDTGKLHRLIYNRVGDHAIVLDGTVLASGNNCATTANVHIGRRSGSTNYKGRIYSFRATDRATGEVVVDMVPAKSADGVIGFFDRVTGRFIGPSGSSTSSVLGPEAPFSDFSVSPVPVQHDWSGGAGRPSTGATPALVVSNLTAGVELEQGVHYTVSYSDNVSNGVASAHITGIGDYSGQHDTVLFRVFNSIYEKYRPLEYLESTACAPWIGIDYIHKTSTRTEMVSCIDSSKLRLANYQASFGSRRGGAANESFNFFFKFNGQNRPAWTRNAETQGSDNSYPYDEWVTLECGLDSGLKATWTGETSGKTGSLTSSKNVAGSVPFALFCLNNYNGYGYNYTGDSPAAMKLKSFKIYEDDALVHDYVPARRISDGTLGVYDVIDDQFFSNRGSGSFTAGPEASKLQIAAAIPDQSIVGGAPAEPAVVVTDATTGETLEEGVHYSVSYSGNDTPGTGRVILTGLGAYAGEIGGKDFKTYDGGPATPYPNLSRSYVPDGLIGFWDGIDNSGTGTHDPAAATWVDLSGLGYHGTMNGIATWANGNAMHNEADGHPCVLPAAFSSNWNWHDVTVEFAFRPSELAATRAIFSNYSGASPWGTIISHNNGTTYTDGSIRLYNRDTGGAGDTKIASVVKAGERAYFTILSEYNYMFAFRDSATDVPVNSGSVYGRKVSTSAFEIGGQPDNAAYGMRGDIHFVRVYSRNLDETERAFNRALDVIRYENKSLKYVLPAELPDGYEYDAARDVLRVKIGANAIHTKGLVSINGATAAKMPETFVDIGSTVTLEYSGDGFLGWTNLPSVYTYPGTPTSGRVTFTAAAPVRAVALSSARSAAESELTPYSYVQKGIVRLWDGIDNVGTGVHENTNRWIDLAGSGAQWILRENYGSFAAKALALAGTNKDSAYSEDPVPGYLSVEFCVRKTSGRNLFSNRDDMSRIFILDNDGAFGAYRWHDGSANCQRACQYGYSPLLLEAGNDVTLSAVYANLLSPMKMPDLVYYCNGRRAPYGKSPANFWGQGDYPALGSRYNNNDNVVNGLLYSIRMYDRTLEPVEVAFNAALDQIRFFGADEAATFANMTLPDGYRWNSTESRLEVRLDLRTVRGASSVASGTWFPVGEEVEVVFTPSRPGSPVRWLGLPLKSTLSADKTTLSYTAAAPASVTVMAEQELPALAYVPNGLVALYDAKENVAPGVHSGTTLEWHDLTGRNRQPWTLVRGRASFLDDALEVGGHLAWAGYCPIHQENLLPDWQSVEANITPFRTNGAMLVVFDRNVSRILAVNADPGSRFFCGNKSSKASCATDPAVAGFANDTYSSVYADGGTAPSAFYLGGREITARTVASVDWSTDNDYPSLGGRYNSGDGRYLGLFHVVRLYGRELSATEVAFNAAIDKVRYQGASLPDVLPATLPEGYRYNPAAAALEVNIRAFAAEGSLAVNGGSETNVWVEVGGEVAITATPGAGRGVRDWTGLPGDATISADARTVTFRAASPVEAAVEFANTTAATPASAYNTDGLLAAWDALDANFTSDGWAASGEMPKRTNCLALDGENYIHSTVAGVKSALMEKALTVQMFLRPRNFRWSGGYIHIGTGADVRDLLLSMQGDRSMKSWRGAFGALQYAATSSMNLSYSGIAKPTAEYFGRDTLVSIVRDAEGAKLAIDDGDFCVTNTAYSSIPTTDLVNIGKWIGKKAAEFDLYAVRIYNRVLTPAEMRYNGAVDRARFLGEALELPEGYTNDAGVVKVRYTVTVTDGSGLVSLNGGTPAASIDEWVEKGTAARFVFTPASGYALDAWEGFPDTATYGSGGAVVSLKASSPLAISVSGLELSEGDDLFTSSAALPVPATLGGNKVYTFPAGSYTLVAKSDMTIMQALVVGGGGAGGAYCGGGGGGGAVRFVDRPVFIAAGESVVVSVGAGGAIASASGGAGSKGDSSILSAGDLDIESFGGGGGGGWNSTSPSGGGSIASSGGSANMNTAAHIDGWNYDSKSGYPGGISYNGYNCYTYRLYAPGGGGAGGQGESTAGSETALHGGRGLLCAISGTPTIYGSGGGGGGKGGGHGGINAGNGGTGSANGTAGVDGTGSGGGGGGNGTDYYGGKGGDGTIILSIIPGDHSAAAFKVELDDSAPYLGSPVEPEVTVTLGDTVLVKDVDYTVTYVNNTSPGQGAAIVSGIDGSPAEGLTTTRSFTIAQVIFADFTAAGLADGSSWANAMAPQAALTAAQNAFLANGWAEVWFKAGNYTISAALTLARPCAVRGGFLGDDSDPAALDPSNPETVFDGQGIPSKASAVAQALTDSSPLAGLTSTYERIGFGRFKSHGFVKTGGSSIKFKNCRFFNNTWGVGAASTGRGFNLTGTTLATATFDGCEISGNGENASYCHDPGTGFGGYISTFKRVIIDNSSFVTNGWGGSYRTAQGSAIYVTSAPVTARNTKFVANSIKHPGNGGTVNLVNASGGSAFTNCLWLANGNNWYGAFGNGGHSGALYVNLSSKADTVDLDHCTFAYNIEGSMDKYDKGMQYPAPAGLYVYCGSAKVRNSIFWGNSISSDNTAAADVYLHSNGSADIDYTLFGGLGKDYINSYSGGRMVLGDHIVVGDPNFVTRPETVATYMNKPTEFAIPRSKTSAAGFFYSYTASLRLGIASFDVHIAAGSETYSPAIDGSIASWPVGDEPLPNGGIANLGFYGTTAEAATSLLGVPSVDGDFDVSFPDDEAAPEVSFVLGGDGTPYNARVTVSAGTGSAAAAGESYQWTRDFIGLQPGDVVKALSGYMFTPGDTLYVKVTISTPGNADVVYTTTAQVAGEVPVWYGHGGDPAKVVHVRSGSTAHNPAGTSWADAFPDLESAYQKLTSERNEIWVAGDIVHTKEPTYFYCNVATTVRGGFTGAEDSLEERPVDTVSTIDGQMLYNCLRPANLSTLTLERLRFKNGYGYGINRPECNGDLVVEDCDFICNGATNNTNLAGCAIRFIRASNSAYPTRNLTVRRCRFEGNGRRFHGNGQLDGACIYINNAASLTVEDSLFITNGAPFSLSSSSSAAVRPAGTCIYADATPVTVTGCRFAGNRSSSGTDGTATYGGLIYLLNACDGSVIRNCAFVANECVTRTATASKAGALGGSIVVNFAEAIREMFIESCTFAWNLSAGYSFPADVSVNKGVANVHNCIFSGGQLGPGIAADTGRYFKIGSSGSLNIDYSMFDCDLKTAIGGSGKIVIAPSCITNANPRFVTSSPELTLRNPENFYAAYDAGVESVAATCDVHLVSAVGYVDNDGVFHTGGNVVSPAIDAGDPADDCSLEPHPNGGFINLGAYGNTVEASRTYSVEPEIVDNLVTVTFPDDTSFPKVDFDLKAAALDYTATVKVFCGTNGFDSASFESPAMPIRGGEHFTYLQGVEPYVSGSTLYVRVLVTSGDHVLTNDTAITVTGEMPSWWGKGGGKGVIHVWAGAPGANDGSCWRDAFTDINSAIAAVDATTKEIWISGDWRLNNCSFTVTPSRSIAVRGGFAAVENTPKERPANTVSVIDGNNSYNPMVINNGAGVAAEVDRLVLYNAYDRGLAKTGGGDLSVISCTFLTNGQNGTNGDANGKGMRVSSAAGARIFVTNSLFMGNMLIHESFNKSTGQGNGSGIYIDSGASLTVVDCRFNGNGHPSVTPSTNHSENPRAGAFYGGAIYSAVPTHLSYSRFCGNRVIHSYYNNAYYGGGIVVLAGAAGGSTVKNCLFAANQDTQNWSGTSLPVTKQGGALVVSLDSAAGTVEIENSTFAYNLCDGKYCAPGLTVVTGSASVKNCVFGGNMIGANASDKAVDINVRSGSSCIVTYTLLSESGALRPTDVATTAEAGGTLELGSGVIYGDPLFVTPIASITNLVYNFDGSVQKIMYFNPSSKPDWMMQNVDAHVLSESGYFTNDGEEHEAEAGVLSPAIDTGDPFDPLRDEYDAPENRAINQGAYGGTRWASKSASGHAEVDGNVLITFPTEFTQPQVEFTVGGEGTFIASATIYLSSNGGSTWDYVSETIGNLVLGQTVTQRVPLVYEPGTVLTAKVVLVANGMDAVATSQGTRAEGELPPWFGHGGDPAKVVHVREGAFGAGNGSSWADAATSLHEGLRLLTAERNELWFAGTNVVAGASPSYNFDFPVLIRGGFDSTEDSIEERKDGVKSLLTANYLFDNLNLANSQSVYIERIIFSKGQTRNFIRNGGAGDLAFSECEFVDGRSNYTGAGGYFTGSSGKTANLAFTNCVFRNNRFYYGVGYEYGQSGSKAAYFANFASVTIEGCLFVDNGTGFDSVAPLANAKAAVFEATGCRLNVVNTRFVANSDFVSNVGGFISLQTGTGGSVFRNCVFAGNINANDNTYGVSAGSECSMGGIIYVTGNFEERPVITIDHCTFAYNPAGSYGCPAAIYVQRGIVNVSNSIFHANMLSRENICPADIYVRYENDDPLGAQCHVSYSMFDDLGTNNIRAVSGGIITTNNVYVADPLLVTTMDDLLACLPACTVSGARLSLDRKNLRFVNNAATLERLESFNMHLRSRAGWYDERTGEWCSTSGAPSPAIDAGDPAADYSKEPNRAGVGFPGRRVNLGAYGNTPWASMTPHPGNLFILR